MLVVCTGKEESVNDMSPPVSKSCLGTEKERRQDTQIKKKKKKSIRAELAFQKYCQEKICEE